MALDVSKVSVSQWLSRLAEEGEESLRARTHPGRPAGLTFIREKTDSRASLPWSGSLRVSRRNLGCLSLASLFLCGQAWAYRLCGPELFFVAKCTRATKDPRLQRRLP